MSSRVEPALPGAAAEAALARLVAEQHERDTAADIFVVVNSSLVGAGLRHRLATHRPNAGLRVGVQGVLLSLLADVLGLGFEQMTEGVLRSAARVVLAEEPGVLASIVDHPATEASLAGAYRLLAGVDDGVLAGIATRSPRGADVVRLTEAMHSLVGKLYLLPDEVMSALSEGLEARGAVQSNELPALIVRYSPAPSSAVETRLFDALAKVTEVVVVGPAAGSAGVPARLHRVVAAPDAETEFREATRRLLTHVQSGGDLGACVVAYPDGPKANATAHRIAETLRAADLPIYGGSPLTLAELPHGRALLGLMDLAQPKAPGSELERGAVISWLSDSPLSSTAGLARDLATTVEHRPVPVGLWDRCSRAAGVVSGISQWRQRLEAYAANPDRLISGTRADGTLDLLTVVERLHSLTATAGASSWASFAAWLGEALAGLAELSDLAEPFERARRDLEALDAIEDLSGVGLEERLFRQAAALRTCLQPSAGTLGSYGVGPTVGSISQVAGLATELVVVVGCREGEFPARHLGDGLLTPAERSLIGASLNIEDPIVRQHRLAVEMIAGSEASQASFCRIDGNGGRHNHASRWLDGDLFDGEVVEIASFAASLRRVAAGWGPAVDAGELEMAGIVAGTSRRKAELISEIAPEFAGRYSAMRSRRRTGLSRFSGYVGVGTGTEDAWDRPQSATALEEFARCPYRYFASKLLRVDHLEAPEARLVIDARDRGTLMHDVLEEFFAPFVDSARAPYIDNAQLDRLARLAAGAFERLEAEGKTGYAVFWAAERRTVAGDLARYVEKDVAASASEQLLPVAVEFDFGRQTEPVSISTGSGTVRFRGRIDRIDRAPDGSLVVADYKSGRSSNYKDIARSPLGRGSHLQLPIYAKAALMASGADTSIRKGICEAEEETIARSPGGTVPVRAEYRFIQATADYAVIPVHLTNELDAELSAVLGTMMKTIASGCFPPRPGPQGFQSQYDNCRYCDFDAACSTDRAAAWGRATWDPQLRPYVDLVDPSEGPAANPAANPATNPEQ